MEMPWKYWDREATCPRTSVDSYRIGWLRHWKVRDTPRATAIRVNPRRKSKYWWCDMPIRLVIETDGKEFRLVRRDRVAEPAGARSVGLGSAKILTGFMR
jgi:hypothetical protein